MIGLVYVKLDLYVRINPSTIGGRYMILHKPRIMARRRETSRRPVFMSTLLRNFWANEQGATAIEYGLIASLISIAVIASFSSVGAKLSATFHSVSTQLNS